MALYAPMASPDLSAEVEVLVVDTTPQHEPPGPFDVLVVPIDGVDASLNANHTIAYALQHGAQRVVIVKNGTSEGGPRFKREFVTLHEGLPDPRIVVCPSELPRCDAIRRSSLTNRPAWDERGKGAHAILDACDFILGELFPASTAKRTAR